MIGLVLALVMASVCLLVHFETLLLVERFTRGLRRLRTSLLATWGAFLLAHVLEIWLYALVYWLSALAGRGELRGVADGLDYVYFSAVVYTTLGFGDIVPTGDLRMLAGSEALVGLCLIAWSATVTYARVREWEQR